MPFIAIGVQGPLSLEGLLSSVMSRRIGCNWAGCGVASSQYALGQCCVAHIPMFQSLSVHHC
jgi:hypothetical protein